MSKKIISDLQEQFSELKQQGLFKQERIIESSQSAEIEVSGGKKVLNFCANNYLGLSNHPEIIKTAQEIMDKWG